MKKHLSQLLRWTPRPLSGLGRSRENHSLYAGVRRRLRTETLEDRMMLSVDLIPYQNPAMPMDVNNDGFVSPLDALIVINDLNANGPRNLLPSSTLDPDTGLTPSTGGDGTATVDPTGGSSGGITTVPVGPITTGSFTAQAEGAPATYPDVNGDNHISPVDALIILNALNAEGAPGDTVEITLEAIDNDGNVMSNLATDPAFEIEPGEDFFVTVYVEDIRGQATGVDHAFIDMTYDPAIVTPGAGTTFGDDYQSGNWIDATGTSGQIENAGAYATVAPPALGRLELMTIPFHADATGTFDLQTLEAVVGASNVGVFAAPNGFDLVDLDDVDFGGLTIDVVEGVHVDVTFEATDLVGNPINEVEVGSDFYVAVFVQDVRPDSEAHGVRAAYVDMTYTDALATPVMPLEYNGPYGLSQTGDASIGGFVDNAGGETDDRSLGSARQELVQVKYHADAAGTLTLGTDPAGSMFATFNEFGGFVPVDPDDVAFSTDAVTIEVVEPVWVEVTLAATELDGTPLESLPLGGNFYVTVSVEDVRAVPTGISSAVIDLTYDNTLAVTPDEEIDTVPFDTIVYDPRYDTARQGDWASTAGLVDDAGAATADTTILGEPVELMKVLFHADAVGAVAFSADDLAADLPAIEVFDGAATLPIPTENIKIQNLATEVNHWVEISLAAVDAGGNPIDPIDGVDIGEEFFVEVSVQDLRPNATGVSSAYVDITFDQTLVNPTNIFFGTTYDTAPAGSLTATVGRIEDAGATTTDETVDGAKALLMTIPFQARAAGTLDLQSLVADDPDTRIDLFDDAGLPVDVPLSAIRFGGVSAIDVGQWVEVTLEVTTTAGEVLNAVPFNSDFLVSVYVQDMRGDATGVRRANLDLYYTNALVTPTVDPAVVTFGPAYDTMQQPGVIRGFGDHWIDNAGATTTDLTLGSDKQLLMTIPFHADASGPLELNFDELLSSVEVFDDAGAPLDVDSEEIGFDSVAMDVGEVVIRLEVTDLDGNPVTQVEQGDTFLVTAYVMDIAAPRERIDINNEIVIQEGVSAAYMDMIFDGGRVEPVFVEPGGKAVIDHGSDPLDLNRVATGDYATIDNGDGTFTHLLDEVGGVREVTDDTLDEAKARGSQEQFLFRAPFQAIILGDSAPDAPLTFSSDPADIITPIHPLHDTVLYGNDTGTGSPTFPENIRYGSVTIDVLQGSAVKDDFYVINEDELLVVTLDGGLPTLRDNDFDPDNPGGEAWFVQIETNPQHATPFGFVPDPGGDGTFTYQPQANFNGTDTFTYRGWDKNDTGETTDEIATVTITVLPVNDPPFAVADNYNTDEDTPLAMGPGTLLGNDTDVDTEHSLLTAELVTGASNGSVTVDADGSFTYTPDADFHGLDIFQYRAYDGVAYSEPVGVGITVNAVNDAPVADPDKYQVDSNTTLVITNSTTPAGVLANDVDVDGDTIFAVLDQARLPEHGQITFNVDGTFTYQPDSDYFGRDYFYYHATDTRLDSEVVQVEITVGDLAPSTVGGHVYADVNGNGMHDEGERYIGDVEMMIEGTNVLGETVEMTAVTLADGSYQFGELLPGSYTIRQQWQPEYMVDGAETTSIPSADTSVNDAISFTLSSNTEVFDANFGELGVRPEYITHRDSLASTVAEGIVVAIDAFGKQCWYSLQQGWDSIRRVSVSMSENMETAHVSVWDDSGQEYRTSVSMYDTDRFRWLSYRPEGSILRIDGGLEDFTMVRVSQAEGEPVGPVEQSEAALLAALRHGGAEYAGAVDTVLRESVA